MIVLLYLAFAVSSCLYSYTQYDPNLTLFSNPWFLTFQNGGVQLGLFMRAYSAAIFVTIVSLGFILYAFVIRNIQKNKFSFKKLAAILSLISLMGLISYPAFSKDIFNYIFDAKILSHYHLNPYLFKPLDFPTDNWLRFMTWTHRTYPYGPVWLILTAPLNLISQNHFVATLITYKLFFIGNYLLSTYLIYKVINKVNPNKALFAVALFALNPLVLYESVISPHIDISMTMFMLLGVYFFIMERKVWGALSFAVSGGIKFLTLPLVFLPIFKNLKFGGQVKLSIATLLGLLIPIIVMREAYPWYFLPIIALISLLANEKIFPAVMVASFGLVLQYTPYIYYGDYVPEVFFLKNTILVISLISSLTILILSNRPKLKSLLPRW